MKDDRERILDIQEAIHRIAKYATRGKGVFENDELIQNWMIHHLQIIGEAAARVTPEFREQYPDIPWTQIVGMRNILVHNYFGVDTEIVWSVVEKDIPQLKEHIKRILE
jgi:uncharacterized protein with HEPN domain